MFVLIAAFTVCFVTVLMSPTAARAQDDAAIVHKMFNDCVASGGIANTNYNSWVKQNGCICPPSTVGSGQVTCPSPSGNTTGSASTAASPMVTLLQTYQKVLDQARAEEQAARNAATAYNDRVAAGASQDSEMKEDNRAIQRSRQLQSPQGKRGASQPERFRQRAQLGFGISKSKRRKFIG